MSKIFSNFRDPVPAGTVVRLSVPDPSGERVYDWQVVGPFSTSAPERFTDQGPTFDFDTSGRRPGDYDVSATWRYRDGSDDPGDETTPTERGSGTADGISVRGFDPSAGDRFDEDGFDKDDQDDDEGQELKAPVDLGAREARKSAGTSYEPWVVRVAPAVANAGESGVMPVSLQRTSIVPTDDQILWVLIRNRTNAISFRNYKAYIDGVMGAGKLPSDPSAPPPLTFRGSQAYELLKEATDAFLMQEAGVLDDDVADIQMQLNDPRGGSGFASAERLRLGRNLSSGEVARLRDAYYQQLPREKTSVLPYMGIIRDRLADIPVKQPFETPVGAYGILPSSIGGPLALELIWSYWHEEGMLVQTLNAVLARFQNRRLAAGADPLARFDLDPLRPLSNLFWGWAQDELRRLTVRRRSFEYEHEYGLRLVGRAIPSDLTADRRSKFLEAFHNLLFLAHVFFKEDDDTTVLADGFPLLNALRETHLILAEGAHNQFGDLPSAARAEMLMMQWLLARPEMREFLGGRVMVPYEEPWMDRVDSMKQMQGWGDTSITHFRDMGTFGEQLLLSVRYGNWSQVNDPQQASNWARYWRPEIQRYTHAYRSATGVDLTERVDTTTPGFLLQRRLATRAGKRRA